MAFYGWLPEFRRSGEAVRTQIFPPACMAESRFVFAGTNIHELPAVPPQSESQVLSSSFVHAIRTFGLRRLSPLASAFCFHSRWTFP